MQQQAQSAESLAAPGSDAIGPFHQQAFSKPVSQSEGCAVKKEKKEQKKDYQKPSLTKHRKLMDVTELVASGKPI
ncbi:MAG: hypothetical protein JW884_03190 [Deltaproteobacteria bacterium]|nr:hypothetical protein [Deltaproteobacteria bacterium]